MKEFFRKSLSFAVALSKDPRIPSRDKAVLAGMLALVVSPFDIIPDFIPVLGQLDDLMILLLMLDYACNRVPDEVLREHFPWEPRHLLAWRRRVGFFVKLVPHWVKDKIWMARERIGEPQDAATADPV
ncbi:MAG: hypothetical protein JWO30_2109 [Fibrobacteres bacterium]|nr:hypothetical protein [Fibrobacterota bacterium]